MSQTSRRRFLSFLGIGSAGAALAACGEPVTPLTQQSATPIIGEVRTVFSHFETVPDYSHTHSISTYEMPSHTHTFACARSAAVGCTKLVQWNGAEWIDIGSAA